MNGRFCKGEDQSHWCPDTVAVLCRSPVPGVVLGHLLWPGPQQSQRVLIAILCFTSSCCKLSTSAKVLAERLNGVWWFLLEGTVAKMLEVMKPWSRARTLVPAWATCFQ